MSRIGKKPVSIPAGVKVRTNGRVLIVEGKLGTLEALMPEVVKVSVEGQTAHVSVTSAERQARSYQGLIRALLANMVRGVTAGYEIALEINGVGYKAELKGKRLVCSLGYTHLVELALPPGINIVVDKQQTKLTVSGADKQLVGQIAAQIRNFKVPEPYKGKGVKYADEKIRRKVGKAGTK